MAMGTNRDYKTTDRRARQQLKRHQELMDQLRKAEPSMTREEASTRALEIMERRVSRTKEMQP